MKSNLRLNRALANILLSECQSDALCRNGTSGASSSCKENHMQLVSCQQRACLSLGRDRSCTTHVHHLTRTHICSCTPGSWRHRSPACRHVASLHYMKG